jgi:hypothetical protein
MLHEFNRQLLEVNGETGHSYRLQRRNEAAFDMAALNEVRHRAMALGHEAITGAVRDSVDGRDGVIKLLPELSDDERRQLGEETELSIEPIFH